MKSLVGLCFTAATAALQFGYGAATEVRAIAAGMHTTSMLLSRLSLQVQSPSPRLVTLRQGPFVSPQVTVVGYESVPFTPMETHSYTIEVNRTANDMLATIGYTSQDIDSGGMTIHVARRTDDGTKWILDMTQIGRLNLMGSLAGEYLVLKREAQGRAMEEPELRKRREGKGIVERAEISDQCVTWLRYCASMTSDPKNPSPPPRPPAPILGTPPPPQQTGPGLGPAPDPTPPPAAASAANNGNGLGPPATDGPPTPLPAMQNTGGPFQVAPSFAIKQEAWQWKLTFVVGLFVFLI